MAQLMLSRITYRGRLHRVCGAGALGKAINLRIDCENGQFTVCTKVKEVLNQLRVTFTASKCRFITHYGLTSNLQETHSESTQAHMQSHSHASTDIEL